MHERVRAAVLTDIEQNAWQLASIQLSGWTSLPILATSVLILRENSFYGAALTIFVGNGLLWFIRLIVILMSHHKRLSTLDLSKQYLGRLGGYFIGMLCILSSLAWFVAQTTAAGDTLLSLIPFHENGHINRFVQISVLLGVLSTFLCMNGMVVLRWLCVICFPLLLVAVLFIFVTMPFQLPAGGEAKLSLQGLALIVGANLGITADLPTFFRHSRSLATSITALTWIQLISLVLALGGLFFGPIVTDFLTLNSATVMGTQSEILRIALIVLVFLSVICANVGNVYSASVGWEVLAPTPLVGRREYLILGLCLTTVFILMMGIVPVGFLLTSTDNALINLCLVFLLGYFISRIQKRAPDEFEKKTYFGAWLCASVLNALQGMFVVGDGISTLAVGFMSIVLVLFFILGARFTQPGRSF